MAKITLAQAIRVRKRLQGEIRKITAKALAESHTSDSRHWREGDPKPEIAVDRDRFKAAWQALQSAKDQLVALKASIATANGPVHADIVRLGELKDTLALLAQLDTRNDERIDWGGRIGDPQLRYLHVESSAMDEDERDAQVKKIEAEIEEIEVRLAAHNFNTMIEIAEG